MQTVINTVIGISKHAAYLIESSLIARVKKLTSGGGGELILAKVMDSTLRKRFGEIVVQKLVFIINNTSTDAFYQEVGVMIMLSAFPHFCLILGYTENPLSIILKYYPDGSLYEFLRKIKLKTRYVLKILNEVSVALNIMHDHYLAHCDIKSQNVLVEVINNVPSCYLTDFGIAQILSERIIATKAFHVINLRGLSVSYAAPEALYNFRSKKYSGTDFKKYDIYSLACMTFEVLTKQMPWS
jgi:serine/threonine protein kinase